MKIYQTLGLMALLAAVSACHATEGLGKDFEALGNTLEKNADENNTYKARQTQPAPYTP